MSAEQELFTEDKLEYKYYQTFAKSLKFSVKANNDAHIALVPCLNSEKMIEIFIGGWGNSKTVIRVNQQKPDVATAETPYILSPDEFREFYLEWDNHIVTLSSSSSGQIVQWTSPEPFEVAHFGLCTGWGATGEWKIIPVSAEGKWIPASKGEVPPNAIEGGFDNEQLFIARAELNGAMIPGKLLPSHGLCYVAWGGQEHGIENYEVLCGYRTAWVPASNGVVPPGAFPGGSSEDGETLYIARVDHLGTKTIGKVHPSHNSSYISYGGQEIPYADYEVLVLQ